MSSAVPAGSQQRLIYDEEEVRDLLDIDVSWRFNPSGRPSVNSRWKGAAMFASTGFLVSGLALIPFGAPRLTGFAASGRIVDAEAVPMGCRDVTRDDPCWTEIMWAMTTGIRMFPQEYRGLTASSSFENFQAQLHKMSSGDCPMPCKPSGGEVWQSEEYDNSEALAGEGTEGVVPTPQSQLEAPLVGQNAGVCKDADEGDDCYVAVIWALSIGVDQHPEMYKGMLSTLSGFSDGQAALHKLGIGNCQRPCAGTGVISVEAGGIDYDSVGSGINSHDMDTDMRSDWVQDTHETECRDATHENGRECYKSVLWAQIFGIYQHRDWYPGLSPDSSFGEFQADLHKKKHGNCTRPCTMADPPYAKPDGTSLFCFSFVVPGSTEEQLVKFMLNKGNGIFACDDFRVVSTRMIKMGSLRGADVYTVVNNDAAAKKRDSWHNSELFETTWQFLMREVRVMFDKDWIVKVDPDCVFFPDRLKAHISQHAVVGARQFFSNCNSPWGASNLYGAMEVFSVEAIKVYHALGSECGDNGYWRNQGEDLYIQVCMEHRLRVTKVGEFTLVGDQRCPNAKAPCWDGSRASFHPYKDMHSFQSCFGQATR